MIFLKNNNTNLNNKKFIPKNTDDLYLQMKKNDFHGKLSRDKELIVWELDNNIILNILVNNQPHEGYIDTYYLNNGKRIPLTHWHPMDDEIYDDLVDINLGKTIWVTKKNIFGKSVPIIMDRTEYECMKDREKRKYTVI